GTLADGDDGTRIAPGWRWAIDAAWAIGGGRQPVCPLRPVPRVLPDVLGARDGDGLAARAHLPRQVPGRRKDVAQRLDGAASFALSRLPRVRDRVSGRGAVRAAHRSGQGRDRAPTAGRAGAPALPLVELRASAGAPAPARPRRIGGALLSSERTPAARPENGSHPALAWNAAGLGRALAAGPGEVRARAAAKRHPRGGSATRSRGSADRVHPVRHL